MLSSLLCQIRLIHTLILISLPYDKNLLLLSQKFKAHSDIKKKKHFIGRWGFGLFIYTRVSPKIKMFIPSHFRQKMCRHWQKIYKASKMNWEKLFINNPRKYWNKMKRSFSKKKSPISRAKQLPSWQKVRRFFLTVIKLQELIIIWKLLTVTVIIMRKSKSKLFYPIYSIYITISRK